VMRFVLCDDDDLVRSAVEGMVDDLGHEVVGVAVATAPAVHLIEAARPEVVILDLSLGYNTDFDVIEAALGVGATPIVFSQNADDAVLARYESRPLVVFKPDLPALERVVARLALDHIAGVVEEDRRRRPAAAPEGPEPTSVEDAQAFYVALNAANEGDVLLSIELPADGIDVAQQVKAIMRGSDRLLASSSSVRVYLPGGEEAAVGSFVARLRAVAPLPEGTRVRSVVIAPGEAPADAFDRLKHSGEEHPFLDQPVS